MKAQKLRSSKVTSQKSKAKNSGLGTPPVFGAKTGSVPFLPLAFCILALVGLAVAGETGKILGRALDAKTGEPIIGAVVEVEGTELGSNTDESGRYMILNVPAGTWSVTVTAMGYTTTTKSNILVLTDQSITEDFRLSTKMIALPVVEVVDKRPMVTRSAVATTRVVTSQEFSRLPVAVLGQLVGLQAGVKQTQGGGWTHIRGGRYNDVSYLIDGVSAKDALVGTLWSSPRPTAENIAEVEVITGSFDAEYGEAMSGVIQTVTKEGGDRTSTRLRYTTDRMFPKKDLNFGYNLAQWTLGGPLFFRPLRYFFSTEYFRTNDSRDALYQVRAPRSEYTAEGKLNFSLPKSSLGNLKLIADGHVSDYEWQRYSQSWKYHLDNYIASRVSSYKSNFRLNYLGANSMLVEVAAGLFSTALTQGNRDHQLEREDTVGNIGILRRNGLWNRYLFKSYNWVFNNPCSTYVDDNGDTVAGPMSPEVAVLRMNKAFRIRGTDTIWDNWQAGEYAGGNPYGVPGRLRTIDPYGFVTVGDYYVHYRSTADRYVKGSITFAPNRIHEFKTGVDLKWYDLKLYENQLPYSEFPFFENYHKQPFTAAAYLQDKADFEDLVVRAGVRLDFLNAEDSVRVFPESIGGSAGVRDQLVQVGYKWRISPRLGLSYPLTDRIKFRFSYGHFFRNPDFDNLYSSLLSAEEIARRSNTIVGNPGMSAEKTVGYEMGFDAQVSDVFEFDFTAFYKDVYDLAGIEVVPALPSYTMYTNIAYARIKGFEATAAKALSNYWSAKLNYSLTLAQGTASTAYDQYQVLNPIQLDYYLDQDQRHAVSFDFGLSFDPSYRFVALRDFDATLIARYGTGYPYTPTNIRGERTGMQNSGRMPDVFGMDSRLSKSLRLGKLRLDLICDIFNILNAEQVAIVYAATGTADNTGQIITINDLYWPAARVGDYGYHPARDPNHDGYITRLEWYESYMAAYNDLSQTPLYYGPSRKIRFGVSLSF
jgi:outer membrane receptor protein involved in Fe transport